MKNVALITGATAGIGEATAWKMATEGWDLILTGRREERLLKIAADLHAKYGTAVHPLCFDIRKNEEVKAAIASIPQAFQRVSVLVNNAGLAAGLATFDEADMDDWETMIDTNIKGLLYMSRALLPLLLKNGNGQIVNVGSIASKQAYELGNVYCSTKAFVDMLSRSMRIDLAKHTLKVMAIHPGAVDTEFSLVRFKGDQPRAEKVYEGYEPLHATDIANAIWFMLNQPPHVTINELTIMPTAQPAVGIIHRKG